MKFTWFIGIDVSKKTLDITIRTKYSILKTVKIENSVPILKVFLKELKKDIDLSNCLFCMEHTGVYCTPMMTLSEKLKLNLWLENATQIKLSIGMQRGKNDQIDATRIAEYGARFSDKVRLFEAPRESMKKLRALTVLRKRIQLSLIELQTLNKEKDFYSDKKFYTSMSKKAISGLKQNLLDIEKQIRLLIKSDDKLNSLFEIVTSVRGIGEVVGVQMILTTNEFKDFNCPKKYACYAGVAPFEHTSGTSIKGRPRLSRKANMSMKSLLHMAALVSMQCNEELKAFYERRVKEGKSKMSVLNMLRNKLIHRVFACVRDNRKYEYIYTNSLA